MYVYQYVCSNKNDVIRTRFGLTVTDYNNVDNNSNCCNMLSHPAEHFPQGKHNS